MKSVIAGSGSFLGALVLLVTVFIFLFLSSSFDFLKRSSCYELSASFNDVSGLTLGSDILLSGVKIGSVTKIGLDDSSRVLVKMCIDKSVQLPVDSVATISTKNLLVGARFIDIDVGGEDEKLSPGDTFCATRSVLDLEKLVREFISSRINA
ncbi:mce related family protein [Neorickettsia helminthoeca str. Oregon]|uniref:Mce related family protein n=1 Tax=Neorickettsia helminthoeca str. Oregon TaxID=1286528 RepID=X5GWN0_9RICK|nr:MlaD family protein [Neorickettsia helminthoeca]AHX11447.1 mce related family protein [Neorickettsia helminthoeca str. Oregon]